ncbi:MAG: RNA polymerase sigma factor [bacterium]|nr:RNA polymerase sigma factor [bacterium]
MTSPSDNQLMLQVRDGNVEQLGILFDRYQKMLYNFFLRLTNDRAGSEDLVQEVFLRMLKYRHTYRGDGRFTNWMFHISRNTHVDFFKKRNREQQLSDEEQNVASQDSNPGDLMEQNQEVRLLQTALAQLSIEKREVLILSRYQNLKYEDIAEIQECQVGTVKARVHRAINDLRDIYFNLSGEKAA